MDSQNIQNRFSKLFNFHNDKTHLLPSEIDSAEHPFEALYEYFNANAELSYLKKFKDGLQLLTGGKKIKTYCYDCFEFELSMLSSNKNAYLNNIVDILLKLLQKISTAHSKSRYDVPAFRILSGLIKQVLQDIFITYQLDLNSKNRLALSAWFYIKPPVLSFLLIRYPEPKRFNHLFNKYLLANKFISTQTTFETFQALFQEKLLENKINWIGQKSSLYYFIQLLISSKLIKNPKNKHWLIASEFFLLKGEALTPRNFLNQKETQNQIKRKHLEAFVAKLKS